MLIEGAKVGKMEEMEYDLCRVFASQIRFGRVGHVGRVGRVGRVWRFMQDGVDLFLLAG